MATKYVRVTNRSKEPVEITPNAPRPPKDAGPIWGPILLAPGESSYPLPAVLLKGAKGYAALQAQGDVSLHHVPGVTSFVTIENPSRERLEIPMQFRIPKRRSPVSVKFKLAGRASKPVRLASFINKRFLKKQAKRKIIRLSPAGYISPPVLYAPYGYYGSEEVYFCYDCGGPIVFRYAWHQPIHVGRWGWLHWPLFRG